MMKPPHAGLIIGVAVIATAVSGCTGMLPSEPTPSSTAVAGCSPSSTAIDWDEATDDGIDLVQQNQTSYGADGVSTRGGSSLRQEPTVQPFSLLESLGGDGEEWNAALLSGARSSGEVPDSFGDTSSLTDTTAVDIPDPEEGTYVRAVVGTYLKVPFQLTCESGVIASGTIVAVDPTTFSTVSLFCEDVFDPEKPGNAEVVAAHSACDTAAR
jgi:hypothetical protein